MIWFQKEFPIIAERGRDLCDLILQADYQTPDQQRETFRHVIIRPELEPYVSIVQARQPSEIAMKPPYDGVRKWLSPK